LGFPNGVQSALIKAEFQPLFSKEKNGFPCQRKFSRGIIKLFKFFLPMTTLLKMRPILEFVVTYPTKQSPMTCLVGSVGTGSIGVSS
jgi:hypothetical protein